MDLARLSKGSILSIQHLKVGNSMKVKSKLLELIYCSGKEL
jgi:hypothetical protein